MAAHQLGAAGADNAGDAENLAFPHRETDVGKGAGRGAKPFDPQNLARTRGNDMGKEAVDTAPHHVAQQNLHRHLRGLMLGDPPAIAQNHDAVGDARRFPPADG